MGDTGLWSSRQPALRTGRGTASDRPESKAPTCLKEMIRHGLKDRMYVLDGLRVGNQNRNGKVTV